jgi:acetoin utilization deacetylase AcuC-like enzyme
MVSAPVLFRHASSREHETGPGHPERPERIASLERDLLALNWLGYEVRESPAATDALLHAVHPAAYVEEIELLCRRGGGLIDADTVVSEGSCRAARHAAGGAAALVDALLAADAARVGAALHRPPGHHADATRAMGFCLFNNVAVAARHALDAHGAGRVLILDWDVHHGNGTNDIFHADPSVLFCSIHEWPLYPGTGPGSDVGSGAGEGYTVNLPVPGGSGDAVHGSLVEHLVAPLIRAWRPQLVLVSAGFDAHRDDPLARCRLSEHGFAAMTASLRRACAEVEAPIGLVLEGGYAVEALASSVASLIPVLSAAEPPEAPALDVHPLTVAAWDRLAPWWPEAAAHFATSRRM